MSPVHSAETAVLLDRDGTINRNYPDGPVYQLEQFELLPNAAKAVRKLNDADLAVLVVSNQGGIHHRDRDFDWERYKEIEEKMHRLLMDEAGARIQSVYVCPDADYEKSANRKPNTGLLELAQREYGFSAERSFIIGDSTEDIIAGKRFGLRTMLVTSGWKKGVNEELAACGHTPDWTGGDLLEAIEYVLAETGRG